jgi:zinc transport system ATP-binding protein
VSPAVEVRDGRFGYQGHTVVEASLQVEAGEVVALVGPNGSGKSTLLKGIVGVVERHGGSVSVFGQPIERHGDRGRLGYLPQRQSAAGPVPVTVRELVAAGRLGRTGLFHRPRAADRAAVANAIAAVGLTEHAARPVGSLSGGQQRRALVARALAGEPDLLLLDEPLAGVDHASQDALAGTVAARVAEGATVVVVLHELGPFAPLITRVGCLGAGRLTYDGPVGTAPAHVLGGGFDHDHHGGEPRAMGLGLLG